MLNNNKILNVKVNPELANIKLGKINLEWSQHAIKRSYEKNVLVRYEDNMPTGVVQEMSRVMTPEGSRIKLVVRMPSTLQADHDECLVLLQQFNKATGKYYYTVLTCYLNHHNDNHSSLDLVRLAG